MTLSTGVFSVIVCWFMSAVKEGAKLSDKTPPGANRQVTMDSNRAPLRQLGSKVAIVKSCANC